jgi:hypothetical protein
LNGSRPKPYALSRLNAGNVLLNYYRGQLQDGQENTTTDETFH